MAGKIFISYRRSETAWAARALFERLARRFPDRVFIDLEGISLGSVFTEAIDRHLKGCHAMVAVIGATWLSEIQDREKHGEEDFVRIELARSLTRGIPIVPVLVDGAPMPRARELPDDLKAVTRRNGLPLVADTFEAQMTRLEREVHKILTEAGDLPIAADPFASVKLQLESARPDAGVAKPSVPAAAAIVKPRAKWMSDEGTDQFGRWAEFKVDNVIQRLRWIEPGEFKMGSTAEDIERLASGADPLVVEYLRREMPQHRVQIRAPFWIADTPVTQILWECLLGENPSLFKNEDFPVTNISWNDVTSKLLPALNRLIGDTSVISLPTEAQWEYACRAGTGTEFSFGDLIDDDEANYDSTHPFPGSTGAGEARNRPTGVKLFSANRFGLFQMHGNVWEWCADWFGAYERGYLMDPTGPLTGTLRVLRGGSWSSGPRRCRSAARNAESPEFALGDAGVRLRIAG